MHDSAYTVRLAEDAKHPNATSRLKPAKYSPMTDEARYALYIGMVRHRTKYRLMRVTNQVAYSSHMFSHIDIDTANKSCYNMFSVLKPRTEPCGGNFAYFIFVL